MLREVMTSQRMTACRICGSSEIVRIGTVEYISGYSWDVFDCAVCGCIFTKHDQNIYDVLHETGGISYYSRYKSLAHECQAYFARGEKEKLERILTSVSKYKFIIERAAIEPPDARLLELGSSRGYLTSYFIMNDRHILGVDVSSAAVENARALFGDHFALEGDSRIAAEAPYDIIYHVGLMGCVADPVKLTRDLLSLLRPGGRLLFNAPNRAARHLVRQLWIDSAPPPDLVTLFPQGFWRQQFSDFADVTEEVETVSDNRALVIGLEKLLRRRWRAPNAQDIHQAGENGNFWTQDRGGAWSLFLRACTKAGRLSGLSALAPLRPAEFGLFITMKRK